MFASSTGAPSSLIASSIYRRPPRVKFKCLAPASHAFELKWFRRRSISPATISTPCKWEPLRITRTPAGSAPGTRRDMARRKSPSSKARFLSTGCWSVREPSPEAAQQLAAQLRTGREELFIVRLDSKTQAATPPPAGADVTSAASSVLKKVVVREVSCGCATLFTGPFPPKRSWCNHNSLVICRRLDSGRQFAGHAPGTPPNQAHEQIALSCLDPRRDRDRQGSGCKGHSQHGAARPFRGHRLLFAGRSP